MITRSTLGVLALLCTAGCDAGPAPPVDVPFRALAGVYISAPPGGPTTPIGTAVGEFVFWTQAEWEAAVIDAREGDVDLADSVVVAYAYAAYNACASGGHVERVARSDGRLTVTLAPVETPKVCMADRPFHALAVVARADVPAGTEVAFEVPERLPSPEEGAP